MSVKKYRIMYIESKDGVAALDAIIGRVWLSKSGKTLTYRGQEIQSLKGRGFKANHVDQNGHHYWVSGCREDGNDGLYNTMIHVDEDIREEYWTTIRGLPEHKNQSSFRSRGKHRVGRKDLKNKVGNL